MRLVYPDASAARACQGTRGVVLCDELPGDKLRHAPILVWGENFRRLSDLGRRAGVTKGLMRRLSREAPVQGVRAFVASLTSVLRPETGSRFEGELQEELETHVTMLASDYEALGLSPSEARRRALIAFGGLEQVKEQCRDVLWYSGPRRALRILLAATRGR